MWAVLSKTWEEFQKDECPRMAAALAFYTVFSLPAIVIAVVMLVSTLVSALVPLVAEKGPNGEEVSGEKMTRQRLKDYIEETAGKEVADQIDRVLNEPFHTENNWVWLGSVAMLLFGASGALTEIQAALNRAWSVKPDPKQNTWRYFLLKRLFSLSMLLGVALLLLVLVVQSIVLAKFHDWISAYAPAWLSSPVTSTLNIVVSFAIITLLFAAIFRFVPDVKLAWQDVSAGAVVTAILFVIGKTGLGIYLAWSHPGSAYGAAGSVAVVLMWIYYSAMILFLGAEFTQVLASHRGRYFHPQEGAVHAEFVGETETEELR